MKLEKKKTPIKVNRYFLQDSGKPRNFFYERYAMNDESGKVSLRNAILYFQDATINLWLANSPLKTFDIIGPAIPSGNSNFKKNPYIATHFPYPATENWQKVT